MRKRIINGPAVRAIRELKAASDPSFRLGRFSLACDMTPGSLCNIEKGRRKHIDEDVIHVIAARLDVPVEAISYEVEVVMEMAA